MSEGALMQESAASGGDLWLRFGLPALLALMVHGIAVFALMEGWSVTDESRFAPSTSVLEARLIQIEAKVAAPAPAPPAPAPPQRTPTPTPAPAPSTNAAAPAQPAPTTPADRAPVTEPAPPAPTPAATQQTDFEDDALEDLLDRSLEDAIASESAYIDAARADTAVASYVGSIVRRIEQNWSRPPSARNGMQAELRLALVPTGEVVTVDVAVSSGNAAFDRSALAAVRDAAPFEVPADPRLFEREFRTLRILFRPEDLSNR